MYLQLYFIPTTPHKNTQLCTKTEILIEISKLTKTHIYT